MAKYRTKKEIDFNKSVVISFDVTTTDNSFSFGIEHDGGIVKLNGLSNISPSLNNISLKNNVVTFSLMEKSIFSDNLISQKEIIISENNSTSTNDKIVFEKDDKDFLCIDNERIKEDTVIYEKIDDYENKIENFIVIENSVYKKSETWNSDINPIIAVASSKEKSDTFILRLNENDDNLTFLSLDCLCEKDMKDDGVLEIYHEIKNTTIKNALTSFNSIFKNSTNRIRFVFTNNGRLLSISVYDEKEKMYKEYENLSFRKSIDKGYLIIHTSSSSSISNVSTNF